jgi:hypothetical protein
MIGAQRHSGIRGQVEGHTSRLNATNLLKVPQNGCGNRQSVGCTEIGEAPLQPLSQISAECTSCFLLRLTQFPKCFSPKGDFQRNLDDWRLSPLLCNEHGKRFDLGFNSSSKAGVNVRSTYSLAKYANKSSRIAPVAPLESILQCPKGKSLLTIDAKKAILAQ